MADVSAPATTCAEMIALLYQLHSVPVAPSLNLADCLPIYSKNYTFTFEKEKIFASTLAFLSHVKDDPDHIPAVCVHENPQSSILRLLIAVNQANAGDGTQALKEVQTGFEKVFAVLSRVSDVGNEITKDDVFEEIITMCSHRILCRLRLIAPKRGTLKQSVKDTFQRAIDAIRQLQKETLHRRKLQEAATLFLVRAKEVVTLTNMWAKHQTPARLADLARGISRLSQIERLQDLLDIIPNNVMDPSSRKSLSNIVHKITRYWEAATLLRRMAKKFPIVRRMEIVPVILPQEAFDRVMIDQYVPVLASTFARVRGSREKQWNPTHISRLLRTTELDLNYRFAQQTRKILQEAKIHAEIQLLFYCDLEASELPPRIICSSKDACFLCNVFIRVHGKMFTPRSHGRLYPGWRLPHHSNFAHMEQRFSEQLRDILQRSLNTLVAQGRKTVHPDPCESTLLTLPVSVSTLRSFSLSAATIEVKEKALELQEIANTSALSTSSRPRITTLACAASDISLTTEIRLTPEYSGDDQVARNLPPTTLSSEVTKDSDSTIHNESIEIEPAVDHAASPHVLVCTPDTQKSTSEIQSLCQPGVKLSSTASFVAADQPCAHDPSVIVEVSLNSTTCDSARQTSHSASNRSSIDLVYEPQQKHTESTSSCEDQICSRVSHCSMPAVKWPKYHLVLEQSNDFRQTISTPDLELFIEVEHPTTLAVCMTSLSLNDSTCAKPVVDVDELRPGEELVVLTDETQDICKDIYLKVRDRSGVRQQLRLNWRRL